MDTKRLIADTKVDSYSQKNGVITADLPIQNLLDSNAEYLLIIHLLHGDDTLNYYTRIIEPQDCYVKESIDLQKISMKNISKGWKRFSGNLYGTGFFCG